MKPTMPHLHSQLIETKWVGKKGRGVFALTKIPKGTVIERVPVVTFPAAEIFGSTRQSKLAQYVFNWDDGAVAIALGYGSLYNHSFRPNAEFYSEGRLTQVFWAIRDIDAGEEITVNYNGPQRNFDVVES
jgi:SET domain-containing protein